VIDPGALLRDVGQVTGDVYLGLEVLLDLELNIE